MIRSRRGFTMIELLVAMAIALFVVAGLYGIFILQSRQFIFQDLQMGMHQNMRFSTDLLTRSLRIAGFGATGMVAGYGGVPSEDDYLPVLVSHDDWNGDGTDAVTVVYGDPSLVLSTTVTLTESCGTSSLTFPSDMADFEDKLSEYDAGDMLLCMDYAAVGGMESYLWVISGIDGSSGTYTTMSVTDNSVYSDYQTYCPDDENLTPVMACSKGQVLTFYIDNTSDGIGPGSIEHPVLMLDLDQEYPDTDDVPVVDDVEDLQIAWCIDDGTQSVDCTDADSWSNELDMAAGDVPWMARVSVVVRSSRDDPADTYPGVPISVENHVADTTEDHYYREVLTTEVTVRNVRAQAVL